MRNFSNNTSTQSSREFYNTVLKNNNKNLNLSKNEANKIDIYLDKFLLHSYKLLSPIFNEGQESNNFKKETPSNYIDKDFDKKLTNHIPQWIKYIFNLLLSLYYILFPKKILFIMRKIKNNNFRLSPSKTHNRLKTNVKIFQKKAAP